jgi:hypothetical protein
MQMRIEALVHKFVIREIVGASSHVAERPCHGIGPITGSTFYLYLNRNS